LRFRNWRKFWRSTWRQRALLAEAALALTVAEAAIRWAPLRWVGRGMGRNSVESPAANTPEQADRARQIGWALRTAARHLSWNCRCLAQALAGRWMLKRRGIPSTVYLGVGRGRREWLDAHAWLRSGEVVLTGGAGRQRFKTIGVFSEKEAQ
jgi:Transglutaminase-like superfamily